MIRFQLQPFQASNCRVSGDLEVMDSCLRIHYCAHTTVAPFWPEFKTPGRRQHRLWESTCFELFVCPVGSAAYWEFNFSPSGDYQYYAFQAYRQPQSGEVEPGNIMLSARGDEPDYELHAEISEFPFFGARLNLGINAVMHYENGEKHHFALRHVNPKRPDFHDARGFCLTCEPGNS